MSYEEFDKHWAQRPNDKDPFEQFFFAMARYYGKKVDPEVMAIYRRALSGIPVPRLDVCFHAYIEDPNMPPNRLPKVYELKAIYNRRKTNQEAERERRQHWRETPEPKQELQRMQARSLCQRYLATKISGDEPSGGDDANPDVGGFACEQLVNVVYQDYGYDQAHREALRLQAAWPDLERYDAECFMKLRQLFDQEWENHMEQQTTEGT